MKLKWPKPNIWSAATGGRFCFRPDNSANEKRRQVAALKYELKLKL
jgi:hypothetical protein